MVTINEQAFLFLTCVKTGIIMGMFYDLIRVFRKIIHHPNWAVQIEDLLYWVTCGGFAFTMIYWRNYGEIRSFVFLGVIIGLILYFCTVSILFMKVTTKVINMAKRIINQMIHFILIPIKCIITIICIPITHTRKICARIRIKRQLSKQRLRAKWRNRTVKLKAQLKIIRGKR